MKTLLLAAATLASAASFAQTTAPSFHQQKKAQVAIAKTPAPASFLKAASKAPEMITEQPEGKLYKDMYGYSEGFISQWGMIYEDVKDGVARDFVVGDDGSYYMKSPISSQPTDSWIKGDKAEGDTIVFKLPQQIYTLDYGDGNPIKYYASRMVYQQIDGENQYVIDEKSQDIKFVWRNDSLIKCENDVLLGMSSEAGSWNGLGDLVSVTTICPFVNEAPKDMSKVAKYIFTFHPSERTTTQRISQVVIEGDDFYADNIDANIPDAWIHGKIKDGKVVFSGAQFLGLDKNASQYRFNFPANVYYDEETYMTEYKTLDEVSFDYDAATGNLSNCQYGFMSNYGYRLISLNMQVMMQPTFEVWDGIVARPQNPNVMQYVPAETSSGWVIFDLPRNNVENSFIDQSNVYYNIYFDDELATFYPDQYLGIEEEMTDVPVDFNDTQRYDFQSFGSQHRVVIYDSGIARVGVRAVYVNGDERLYSDIVYSDGSVVTGIKNASADAKTMSVTYYDLGGRKVQNPKHGVFIKKTVMSDGKVRTEKINKNN